MSARVRTTDGRVSHVLVATWSDDGLQCWRRTSWKFHVRENWADFYLIKTGSTNLFPSLAGFEVGVRDEPQNTIVELTKYLPYCTWVLDRLGLWRGRVMSADSREPTDLTWVERKPGELPLPPEEAEVFEMLGSLPFTWPNDELLAWVEESWPEDCASAREDEQRTLREGG
jgi:hypothetical protein